MDFLRNLFTIAFPIIAQNFLSSFVNMLDTIMVGQLGSVDIAAVGLGNQIFFVMSVIMFGVVSGGSLFISQFWGKKAQGITPTFEYCLDRFEDFRGEHVDSSTPVSLFVNMIHNGHDNISFGNKYDESTGEFVEMMKQYGLDIPVGVDHTPGNEVVTMDRSYYGGMTQIDKSICNDKIEQAYNEGKITEEGRDKLREKLYSC